jgi:hypothetical protein
MRFLKSWTSVCVVELLYGQTCYILLQHAKECRGWLINNTPKEYHLATGFMIMIGRMKTSLANGNRQGITMKLKSVVYSSTKCLFNVCAT